MLQLKDGKKTISRKLRRVTPYNSWRISHAHISFVTATAGWAQNGIPVAGGHGPGEVTHQLHYPYDLQVDEEETVIVAEWGNHRIVEWKRGEMSSRVLAGGNGRGKRSDQLNQPTDVLVGRVTDSPIICDAGNPRVTRWSRRSGPQSGKTIIDSIACHGLAMDEEGALYVTNTEKHEVIRYRQGEASGTVVAGGNGEGDGLHQLNGPYFVCVDGDHAVYVSDTWNHRVMKWVKGAKEGIVVAGGQGEGKKLMQLSSPGGSLVDVSGSVYVADSGNHHGMRWCGEATQSTVVVGGNGEGKGANQFHFPTGLSFDRQGNLYVADYWNNRVQRFSIEKNWIKSIFLARIIADDRLHTHATRKLLFCWWSRRTATPCTNRASPLATWGRQQMTRGARRVPGSAEAVFWSVGTRSYWGQQQKKREGDEVSEIPRII